MGSANETMRKSNASLSKMEKSNASLSKRINIGPAYPKARIRARAKGDRINTLEGQIVRLNKSLSVKVPIVRKLENKLEKKIEALGRIKSK